MAIFKILVIEDDQDILEILDYVLSDDGYEVIASKDGVILADIHTIKPDLIFLDEWLKDERGSQLCLKLKADPQTAAIPVILISAQNNLESLVKKVAADGYISKPFNIDDVIQTVNRFLKP